MANVLPHEKRKLILRLLCEGNSIRSASRIVGVHKNSVERCILSFGKAARNFLDDQMRNLTLEHVEVDEMYTFVAKKQKRLTTEERALRHDIGDIYLWLCIDATTKLIPSYLLGKRSGDNARRLMMDLRGRLLDTARPHDSDDHAFERGEYAAVTQISTDGFTAYPEAVDLAFGPYVKYGQIIKEYRSHDMPGRYAPAEMVSTQRRPIRGDISPWDIGTSHVERQNLTVRTFMKRFTRLSLGFSKKLEPLAAAVSMYVAYYNFVWRTRYPDGSGKSGKLRPTAAMMAGVTERLWKFDDLYDQVLYY